MCTVDDSVYNVCFHRWAVNWRNPYLVYLQVKFLLTIEVIQIQEINAFRSQRSQIF
jgi:hypothetical protein